MFFYDYRKYAKKFIFVVLVFQITAILSLKKDTGNFTFLYTCVSSSGTLKFLVPKQGHDAYSFSDSQCWIFTHFIIQHCHASKNGKQTAYKSNTAPKMNSQTIYTYNKKNSHSNSKT